MPLQAGSVVRFSGLASNAYLVDDGGALTLVDAGTPWDTDGLRRTLSDAGVSPGDVDRVLLTHYDLDHVGTLATLGLDADAPIHVAEPDASFLLRDADPPVGNHKGAFQRATRPFVDVPDNEVRRVNDGDDIGGFTAYRTPGHTPGHVVYVHEGHGAAFLGDVVSADDGALTPSPWAICYDVDRNRASVVEAADRVPRFEAACPGHGDPIRAGGYDALRRAADGVRETTAEPGHEGERGVP